MARRSAPEPDDPVGAAAVPARPAAGSSGGTGAGSGRGGGRSGRRRGRTPDEPPDDGSRPPSPDADPRSVARTIALRLLAGRPRTRAELDAALARRGVAPDLAAEVLDRFAELGYVDDAAFARAWVATRHRDRGLAGRALGFELRRKGVGADEAAEALAELDPEQETATAVALAQRRARAMTRLAPEVRRRRLAGMLARKGYPAGVVAHAVRAALADTPDEADEADEAGEAGEPAGIDGGIDRPER